MLMIDAPISWRDVFSAFIVLQVFKDVHALSACGATLLHTNRLPGHPHILVVSTGFEPVIRSITISSGIRTPIDRTADTWLFQDRSKPLLYVPTFSVVWVSVLGQETPSVRKTTIVLWATNKNPRLLYIVTLTSQQSPSSVRVWKKTACWLKRIRTLILRPLSPHKGFRYFVLLCSITP